MAMPNAVASQSLPAPGARSRVLDGILMGSALAGTLDILSAVVVSIARGSTPIRMLQGIASGVLGASAVQGGLAPAALGLALHFFIATCWTTLYVLVSQKLPVLIQKPFVCGPIYGIIVYCFMYYVVIPTTFGRFPAFSWFNLALNVGIHICFVGLPIALMTRRAFTR